MKTELLVFSAGSGGICTKWRSSEAEVPTYRLPSACGLAKPTVLRALFRLTEIFDAIYGDRVLRAVPLQWHMVQQRP